MKINKYLCFIPVIFTCSTGYAAVLFDQPYASPTANASQNDPSYGSFATVYDNFNLTQSADINTIGWTGGYFNPPNQGPITGFTVDIWSSVDSNNGASGLLASYTVTGSANESLIDSSNQIYHYSMQLTNDFLAVAGTTYWLSIQADLTFPPQWGWAPGSSGDNVGYQTFLGTTSQIGDSSFELLGNNVPEPASIALLASGILGFAASRRKSTQA